MIRKNVSKRKNLEVFFCCTMSALPLKHIIVKEMVRVINTWIRLTFFWRKSFKENPGKDFSLPLSPLSSFEFWCKTNFYLFIAVALITITCAANFLQLSKKQTCRYLLFWIRGPIHRPILNRLWSGHCLFCHRCPILSFATVLKDEKQKRQVSELMFRFLWLFRWSWKPHFTVSYSSTIFCPRFELNPLFFCNQWRPCRPLQRAPPSLCRIID